MCLGVRAEGTRVGRLRFDGEITSMVRGHAKRAGGGGGAGGSLSWVVVILHTESLFLNVVFFFFFAFCLPFLNSGFRVFCTLGVGLMDFLHGCVSSRVDRMARSAFHP